MSPYERPVMNPPESAAGRSWLAARAAPLFGLCFGLGALGVGCEAPPKQSSPVRSAAVVASPGETHHEPPPPAGVAITPPSSDRLERWAPAARLASRYAGHNALDASFDEPGLHVAIRHAGSISVWRREPSSKSWTQVMNEPWRVERLTWKKEDLLACGPAGAIKASFSAGHAEWRTAEGDECGSGASLSPTAGASLSHGWSVTSARGTEHCSRPRMQQAPPCTYDQNFAITGPAGAQVKLVGSSDSVSALSPSGRFFVSQSVSGVVTVYETNTRATRAADVTEDGYTRPTLRQVRWSPDESAFAVVLNGGSVVLVNPRTGKTTWKEPVPRRTSKTVHLQASTGEPWLGDFADLRQRKALVAEKGPGPYPLTFPGDATRKLVLPGARRSAALGQGTWALWDDAEGKVLRVLGGAVSFEEAPSGRFVAVLLDHCKKALGCGGAVEVVDTVAGTTRWTLELPEVTTFTRVQWFGAAEREILAVVDDSAQLLRPSDGAILHAEPSSTNAEPSPVLWTEGGLVDASDAELKAWTFRPAGRLDQMFEATLLHHPNLWSDFRDGRPLPAQSALDEGTKGP
jgi:hypothetical protein